MNDIKSGNKKRKIGNSSYPEWQINKEHLPIRKETRIGEVVTSKRNKIKDIIDAALQSLNANSQQGTIVSADFVSVRSAFGLHDALPISGIK